MTHGERQTLKESRKKNNKALFMIYQGLDEAWEILNKIYSGVEKIKRIRLQAEETLKC
jgi:ABC-type enterochelin transport system substrate-binding protein